MRRSLRRDRDKSNGYKLNSAIIETMEQRIMLTTFMVTTTGDGGVPGDGSLRSAINASNADTGPQTNVIDFAIGTGGEQAIDLTSGLAVSQSVTIDGESQTGYAGTPIIVLNGAAAGAGALGLDILGNNITVRGFVINGFNGNGLAIDGGSNDTISGNYFGTDDTGTGPGDLLAMPPDLGGIFIFDGASDNTIGGTTAGSGNLISGNVEAIVIQGTASGQQTTGNIVEGNFIGTDVTGTTGIDNQNEGVLIDGGATDNTVGGTVAAARNLISDNEIGVEIRGTASGPQTSGNLVEGNYIGTDVTGTTAISNAGDGVLIDSRAINTTIGGSVAGAGNLISGNMEYGIDVEGPGVPEVPGSFFETVIEGNYIGTDAAGTAALGNEAGVYLNVGAFDNTIGGALPGEGNVISGNYDTGVEVITSTKNLIEGNFIGTDATGTVALGNAYGVWIEGSTDNTIGGAVAGARNVISGNSANAGVLIFNGSSQNVVEGNFIGTDVTGTIGVANAVGVDIWAASVDNTIGGPIPGDGNLIAFNSLDGVDVGLGVADSNSVQNDVRLNSIYGNGDLGIDLSGDGVTPNSPGGPHLGPNDLQNYPFLASAVSNGTTTTIQGVLNSTPSSDFVLDFDSNSALDPDGTEQGKTYLGSEAVATDSGGNATFTVTLNTSVASGQFITATATTLADLPYGETSEFAPPVLDTASSGSSGGSTVDVLTASGDAISATQGSPFTGTVASFTDSNTSAAFSDFTATINWGDGSPISAGTIQANGSGGFNVIGTHTYLAFGTYTTSIKITPASGSAATPTGTATVGDLPLTPATSPLTYKTVEGSASGTDLLGYFTDADPSAVNSDYIGSVNWGDGTVVTPLTSGNIVAVSTSSAGVKFAVYGNHTYTEFGTYHVTINVTDDGGNPSMTGGSAAAVNETTFTVADAPLTAGTAKIALNATEGIASSRAIIGYFTDADPNAVAGNYIGTIKWGDGTSSTAAGGDIVAVSTSSAGVKFAVYGSHVFVHPGQYNVVLSITDDNGNPADTGGSTATIKEAKFTVVDAPLTGYSVTGLTAKKGKTFSGVVATFLDHDPLATTDDYTVTINWGDGTTSNVIPTYSSITGLWSVAGSHKYTKTGTYNIVMTATDGGGQSTTVTSKIKVTA